MKWLNKKKTDEIWASLKRSNMKLLVWSLRRFFFVFVFLQMHLMMIKNFFFADVRLEMCLSITQSLTCPVTRLFQ